MRALVLSLSFFICYVVCNELGDTFSNIENDLDAHSFFGFVESPLENEEQARIINGEEVESAKRPYLAWVKALDSDGNTLRRCTGTILSTTMILTAAQCVWKHGKRPGRQPANIEVIVGDVDYTGDAAVSIMAKNWLIHPDFNWNILNNDIALINLTKPIPFSRNAWNISMPTKDQVKNLDGFAGVTVDAQGWGKNYEDIDPNCPPTTVRNKRQIADYVEMKVMNHTPCAKMLRETFYDLPKMSNCLDTTEGEFGICGADVGGPVTIGSVLRTLIGVLSHYEGCTSWYPNTFTYIGPYLDWIAKNGGPKVKAK